MEDEDLKEKLLEESKSSEYAYERKDIRERYKDTSLLIFKKSNVSHRGSFLSFGSRRSSLVSNYGNTPTFMRRSLSSGGVLEYVEQVQPSKWNAARDLPAIMPEEKEDEIDAKEIGESEIPLIDANITEDKNEHVLGSEPQSSLKILERESSILPSGTFQTSIAESNVTLKDEGESNGDFKNRKSFLHYDMPVSTRNYSQQQKDNNARASSSFIKATETNCEHHTNQKIEHGNSKTLHSSYLLNNKIHIGIDSKPEINGDLHKNPNKHHEDMDEIIDSLRKSINALSELEKSLEKDPQKPVLPCISAIDKSDATKMLVIKDQKSASPILPIPSKPLFDSFRETLSDSPYDNRDQVYGKIFQDRKGSSRLSRSLKEKSEHLDSDSSKYSDCFASFNSLRESVDGENQHLLFPPLIAKADHKDERNSSVEASSLPQFNAFDLSSSNTSHVLPSLNNINEDSSFNGIRNLANDKNINRNFIVRKEANSIGLAPISNWDSPAEHVKNPQQISSTLISQHDMQTKSKKISNSFSSKHQENLERTTSDFNSSGSIEHIHSTSNFLFSHGVIKSIPYNITESSSITEENFECTLDTNKSRLCLLM